MGLKSALLSVADLSGLSALARHASRRQLRILCYHGLWVAPGAPFGNCLFMPPEQFDARMARLKRSGLPVLGLEEAVTRLADDRLPANAVVITIDDAWASTHSHMLPILESHGLPATLYVTSWYAMRDLPVVNVAVAYLHSVAGVPGADAVIARIEALPVDERLAAVRAHGRHLGVDEAWLETRQFHLMRPDEIVDAHSRGLDMQLHTHRHIDVDRDIRRLGEEVAENRAFLADLTDAPPATHFCYPSGSYHPHAPMILAANGVTSATLTDEGINAPGSDPLRLRRFLDATDISERTFDAYLSGTLHYLAALRRRPSRPAPARPQALPGTAPQAAGG